MGYGLGVALIVLGLILALAVEASVSGLDIQMVGWILVLGGAVILGITAVQMNARRRATAVRTTTHSDGSQTVVQRDAEQDPPAPRI